MRARTVASRLFFAVILAILIALPGLFGTDRSTISADATSSVLTVTESGNGYCYNAAGDPPSPVYDDLQSLIDATAEEAEELLQLSFNSVHVSESIILPTNVPVALSGTLYFTLTATDYAIIVPYGAELRLIGVTIDADCGIVDERNGGKLLFVSGTLRVNENDSTAYAAMKLGGQADVRGGTIHYTDAETTGFGLLIETESTVDIHPETTFQVTAPTAIWTKKGNVDVTGGTYTSSGTALSDSPFGCSLALENEPSVHVGDGTFVGPIRLLGQRARLTIDDGTFETLSMPYFNSGFNGLVRLKDATVLPAAHSYVTLDLSDFANDRAAFSSTVGENGNRAISVSDGTHEYETNTAFPLDAEVTYSFSENNDYTLTIYDGENVCFSEQYDYNTHFSIEDLPCAKTGYSVLYVREDTIDGNTISEFTLKSDKSLYIEFLLNECVVQIGTSAFVYNGTAQQVNASVTHALKTDPSASYEPVWEKYVSSAWQLVANTESLSVTTVADSGAYRFSATITHDGSTKNTTQYVNVTVEKGTYLNISHDQLSGEYDPDKTLADYSLTTNFRWVDNTTKPTVPVTSYPAYYNADSANYNDYPLSITLTLTKADAPDPEPALYMSVGWVYSPDRTLADFVISDTRWDEPDLVLNVGFYSSVKAYYNPDGDNYNDRTIFVEIRVTKASYGNKDLSLTLPYSSSYDSFFGIRQYLEREYAGYAVSSGDAPVMGENVYLCVYNTDKKNYNDRSCTITLTLVKATYDPSAVPTHPTILFPHGMALKTANLDAGFRFVDENHVATENGDYPAYYNADSDHYEDYLTSIPVTLLKIEYSLSDIPEIDLSPVVYDPIKTLADVTLPSGFSWKNPNVKPIVNQTSYQGIYHKDGDEWYEPYELDIPLTVQQATLATPVLPDATFVYDGQPHFLVCEPLPEGITLQEYVGNGMINYGRYEVVARLQQEDTVNYKKIPKEIMGILNIQKAPSIIASATRIDVLVGQELTLTGTTDNDEQNVIIPTVSTKTAGVYTVTLRTLESANYLAGSLDVTVYVNNKQKNVGHIDYPDDYDQTYYYGIIRSENGVSEDLDVSLSAVETESHTKAINVSLTKNGVADDGVYEIMLLLPNNVRKKDVTVSNDDGVIESTVQSGVYLVFTIQNGETIYLDYDETENGFVWYWIPPTAAVVLAGIAVLVIYLIRKKKKPALSSEQAPEEPTPENDVKE